MLIRWFSNAARAMTAEFRVVFHDVGVMLFFFVLPLLYPVTYTLIYNPEIVTDIPVAIVDRSQTPQSRELIRKLDATQSMKIYTQAASTDEARDMLFDRKIHAYFVIPEDYARKIGTLEQPQVEAYCDMSLLLRYRQIFSAVTEVQLNLVSDITAERLGATGLSGAVSSVPVQSTQNIMGDPTQGFASFIMPGIIILILQQSMLLGCTLIGGTRRERRLNYQGYDPVEGDLPGHSAVVFGRAMCYVLCYVPMTLYVLHWVPAMFDLPHYGDFTHELIFFFPLLLATAFLGQASVFFSRKREMCFMLVVFSSLVFLFLSGLTWPRYAMSKVWIWCGDLVPATWGVEGFIRMNSNGATIPENTTPYIALWVLAAIYYILAIVVSRYFARVDRRLRLRASRLGIPVPAPDPTASPANPVLLPK